MCAGAPPYPTVNDLRRMIRSGWPVYVHDDGFMCAKPDGETVWVILRPRLAERLAGREAAAATVAVLVELLVAQGRELGALRAPAQQATRASGRTVMQQARLTAAAQLVDEGIHVEVSQ